MNISDSGNMIQALRNMNQTLEAAGDMPEAEVRFSPTGDPEGVSLWKQIVNGRYRKDGIREDFFVRGGSQSEQIVGANIITTKAFSGRAGGAHYEYVLIHQSDGTVDLYNVTTDTLHAGLGSGFSGSTPIQVLPAGRFVYMFDQGGGNASYIDLTGPTSHNWLNQASGQLHNPGTILKSDFNSENVWNYKRGASVIVFPNDKEAITSIESKIQNIPLALDLRFIKEDGTMISSDENNAVVFPNTPDLKPLLDNAGKYVRESRRVIGKLVILSNDAGMDFNFTVTIGDHTTNGISALSTDTPADIADKIEVELAGDGNIAPLWDFERESFGNFNTTVGPESPSILNPDGSSTEVSVSGTGFETIWIISEEADPELEGAEVSLNTTYELTYKGYTAYFSNRANLITNTNYAAPEVFRSYVVVDILKNGSTVLPSRPVSITVDSADILQNGIAGISFDLDAAPSNVAERYLLCTRWQVELDRCFLPSKMYPNSAYYIAQKLDVNQTTVEDFTPDQNLLRDITELLPVNSGIINLFGPGQIQPYSATAYKSGLILGGYTINRPTPAPYSQGDTEGANIFAEELGGTGGGHSSYQLHFLYEYSDGSLSDPVSTFAEGGTVHLAASGTRITLHPPNALIKAVHIYARDTGTGTDYFVTNVSAEMPGFFGKPFTITGVPSDHPVQSIPTGGSANESVDLPSYIALGLPPEMIQVDSAIPLPEPAEIRGIRITGIDDQRNQVIRYTVAVLTNRRPFHGYIVAGIQQGDPQAGDLSFDVELNQASQPAPLESAASLFVLAGTVFYQSNSGLVAFQGGKVTRLVEKDRYDVLGSDLLAAEYHEREQELWFAGVGNQVLVLGLDKDSDTQRYTALMQYPTASARTLRALAFTSGKLYGGFNTHLVETDIPGTLTDSGVLTSGSADIDAELYSDYLSRFGVQVYLDCMELFGTGYQARLAVDLQGSRFDDGGGWTDNFTEDVTVPFFTLDMKGDPLGIYARGIAPRLKLTIRPAADGRLAGLRYYYEPLKNEGAPRL